MKFEDLLDSLDKAASEQAKPTDQTDKPQVSKELDALLTKEAAEENARKAFEDGEKLAHMVLEKMATEVVQASAAKEEVSASKSEEVKSTEQAPVEKTAEAKTTEAPAGLKQEEKDMNKEAQTSAKELASAILEK